MKKVKKLPRRKVKVNLLNPPPLAQPVDSPERIFGTPSSTGPMTPEGIAEMERSYNDFLALRKQRIMENIGRDTISEEPFLREE